MGGELGGYCHEQVAELRASLEHEYDHDLNEHGQMVLRDPLLGRASAK